MPDETHAPPAADKQPAAEKPRLVKGATVEVKTVRDGYVVAEVTKVNRDGTADLAFILHEKPVEITNSPQDPEGKTPDSWRFAAV